MGNGVCCFSIYCLPFVFLSLSTLSTLITVSMGVHPFFHQEEKCNGDDHADAFVFEHIHGRQDGEDEDGLVLLILPITLITASIHSIGKRGG